MIVSSVNSARRVCIQRGRGDLTIADITAAMSELYAGDDFEPDFAVVWDLSRCRLESDLAGIGMLEPGIVRDANEAHPHGKVAWVLGSAGCETLVQMLYRQHPWDTTWRTFARLEAALGWCCHDGFGPRGSALPGSSSAVAAGGARGH